MRRAACSVRHAACGMRRAACGILWAADRRPCAADEWWACTASIASLCIHNPPRARARAAAESGRIWGPPRRCGNPRNKPESTSPQTLLTIVKLGSVWAYSAARCVHLQGQFPKVRVLKDLPRLSGRSGQYGVKVSFWGSGALQNRDLRRKNYPPGHTRCTVKRKAHATL